jgi:hypothetical protein
MKKLVAAVIVFIVFQLASCYIFDNESDISVSLNPPDEITIVNNARASTLRFLDVKIVRADTSERAFHFDIKIPAGDKETVKIDDYVIQNGDKATVVDAVFSWDM